MATTNPYAVGLERVNDAALAPLNFLKCAAFTYPNASPAFRVASTIHARKARTAVVRWLAPALHKRSIGIGNRNGNAVAVLCPAAAGFDSRSGVLAACIPTQNIRQTVPDRRDGCRPNYPDVIALPDNQRR